jgi:outer membrane protein OmpA-like peptidoglycan-associated protein
MNIKSLIALGVALAVGACASTPQTNAALEGARTAVRTAEADPNVNKYAALDLEAAKTQLQVAESAALHHADAQIAQPAYLAVQTARLAQAHAAAKADDARVASGQAERDQIRLSARTREVENAKTATGTALGQRDEAAEQSARLKAEIEQLKATPTSRGLVLTLGDVLFDSGQAELNPGASRKLDQLAQFLTEHPDRRVQIDGFTDSVGPNVYNQELSRRRADAVKSALLARGVDSARIGTEGYGKAFPVASNSDSSGRQLNRRVEVVIGGNDGTPISARSR